MTAFLALIAIVLVAVFGGDAVRGALTDGKHMAERAHSALERHNREFAAERARKAAQRALDERAARRRAEREARRGH